MSILVGIGIALGAGLVGYWIRRWEHHREQRLIAYRTMFLAFYEAANAGADLLSVHTQTGFPHELRREGLAEKDRDRMAGAHEDAWAVAREARHAFHLASFGVELVGSRTALAAVEDLREFLAGSLYSGEPWVRGYPKTGLNPSDIVQKAMDEADPHMRSFAHELWRRPLRKQPSRR